MSAKAKLARQAVKTTAKHTVHTVNSKITRKPVRSVTLLTLGAALGGIVGFLIGRSGGGEGQPGPLAGPPAPTSIVTSPAGQAGNNSTEHASETGAAT